MKKIKTVVYPMYEAEAFDKKINQLLSDGWELKKRSTAQMQGEPNEVGSSPFVCVLYAELEQNVERGGDCGKFHG